MATEKRKSRLMQKEAEPVRKGALDSLVEHARERPLLYIVAAAFVLICVVIGAMYRSKVAVERREAYTALAESVQVQDPTLRVAELEPLNEVADAAPEVAYMLAESAYEARQYDKAREAFQRVVTEYPKSQYAPDAVEGLGYIAENEGNLDEALALYRRVRDEWRGSFTALRQPLNIGRVLEAQASFADALQMYEEQTVIFPDSNVAREAQMNIMRLKEEHPELAPAEAPAEGEAVPAVESGAEAPAGETPETVTLPAEPAADETAPVADEAAPPSEDAAPAGEAAQDPAAGEDAAEEAAPAGETAEEPAPAEAPADSAS